MKKRTIRSSLVDFAKGRLSPEESLKVIDDLEADKSVSEDLEAITRVMNFIEEEGGKEFGAEVSPGRIPVRRFMRVGRLFHQWRFPSPAFSLITILLILAGSVVASRLTTSPYYELTTIERMEFESLERGPGVEDFAVAQRRFAQGRYEEAIRLLERFSRAMPNSPGVDYAHYFAGAVYLVSAHRSFLTLFPSFDRDRVTRGQEHLGKAIDISSNLRILEESHLLRAKGFLMLGRPDDAVEELERARALNGPKRDEATQLLERIRNI